MAEPRMVDPHDVVMTGENSFVRLSDDGGKTIVDRVSHWRVLWSPAGQGHALFIESPLTGKAPRVYADNAGVARFLQRTIEVYLHKPFADESLPVIDAEFERSGNSLSTVQERVALQRRRDRADLLGPDGAVRAHHPAGRDGPPDRRLQHVPAGAQRAALGQRQDGDREGVPDGPLRQAGVELLPGVVGDLDRAGALSGDQAAFRKVRLKRRLPTSG